MLHQRGDVLLVPFPFSDLSATNHAHAPAYIEMYDKALSPRRRARLTPGVQCV